MDTNVDNYLTGDPAFAVNRSGVIVLWNKAAENTLGYKRGSALGEKCWKLLSGQDTYGNRYCCKHCPIRGMAFRHEPVNNFESVYRTATDQPVQFSVSCLTVSNPPDDDMLLHICRHESGVKLTNARPSRIRPSATKQLDPLSQREAEVLALLASKVSTRDIASKLEISVRTVRTHIQHLMYKMRVHKRIDALKAAKRLKLI